MTAVDEGRRAVIAFLAKSSLLGIGGASLGGCEIFWEAIRNRPMRRDLATLGAGDTTVETYRAAVAAMKALPSTDPRNWFRQADIHFDHCPHSNWFFLPWHRAYLLYFEQICRELTGNKTFALPYWNWTCHRTLPTPFQGDASNALFQAGRNGPGGVPAPLLDGTVGTMVMSDILDEPNFLIFGSSPAAGQRDAAGSGPLEGNPHNTVHGHIGGIMGSYQSPQDPIFWMHHNMIERVWWEWSVVRGHANTNDPAWMNFAFNGDFVDRAGVAVNVTVGALGLAPLLLYQFDDSSITACGPMIRRDRVFDVEALRTLLRDGGPVSLRSERTLASAKTIQVKVGEQATEVLNTRDAAATGDATLPADVRLLLRLSDVVQPPSGDFFVRVFLNLPGADVATPTSDVHYAGSFAFFNEPDMPHGAAGHVHMNGNFLVDLTPAVRRLRSGGAIAGGGELRIHLVAVPMTQRLQAQRVLAVGSAELTLARSAAPVPRPFGQTGISAR